MGAILVFGEHCVPTCSQTVISFTFEMEENYLKVKWICFRFSETALES